MKRSVLEVLTSPITAEDVKRVLTTPVLRGRDPDDVEVDARATLRLRERPEGPQLRRARLYDLGEHTRLVQLTFRETLEVLDLVSVPGQTFALRAWNADGWMTEAHVHLAEFDGTTPAVLKDTSGRHAYFTVIGQSPKGRGERALSVSSLPELED
ncbi:hypothetical protein [Deinococcus pimensis]|uniref:hypothetical protein n=1 Tax=Deinococcus pimensis TaxID=309888 RepID=UPI0005EB3F90|nr:hypothetical protein [Deinococcus pimensis]